MNENNLDLVKYSIILEFEDTINNNSTALLSELVHKINDFTLVNALLYTKTRSERLGPAVSGGAIGVGVIILIMVDVLADGSRL